jgi:hypothetical protein
MNLEEWWRSQPPQKRREIDRRAPALRPNQDLVGKHDGRYTVPSPGTRPGKGRETR